MAMRTTTGEMLTPTQLELVRQVKNKVEITGQWNQGLWYDFSTTETDRDKPTAGELLECGTTACVAGWAALLSLSDEDLIDAFRNWNTFSHCDDVIACESLGEVPVSNYAAEVLGLTRDQSSELFYPARTYEEIRAVLAYALANRKWPDNLTDFFRQLEDAWRERRRKVMEAGLSIERDDSDE